MHDHNVLCQAEIQKKYCWNLQGGHYVLGCGLGLSCQAMLDSGWRRGLTQTWVYCAIDKRHEIQSTGTERSASVPAMPLRLRMTERRARRVERGVNHRSECGRSG